MADLAQHYRVTRAIGAAMIASLLIYAVVVEIIRARFAPFEGFTRFPQWEVLRYAFVGLAVADAVLIRSLKARLLAARSAGTAPGAALQTASVVTFALCEVVGLWGFVLFVVAGSLVDFYFFLVLSLLLFGLHFPRWDQWQEWARRFAR